MSTKVSTDLIDLSGNTGGLVWAKGTTAEQPASATAGEMRVDTTTNTTVVYTGTQWKTLKETAFVVPPVPTHFLVVAGGGAGSDYIGGGGGGGGLRTSYGSTSGGGKTPAESTINISLNTTYAITVGEGGVGGTVRRAQSLNGGNSTFSTITSIGGGGSGIGGGDAGSVALVGGSGGGGGSSSSGGAGAAGTADQGYAGGSSGLLSPNYPSAGGGGASAVGVTPASAAATGGNGGSGLAVSITGSSVTYAGGGGGSSISGGGSGGTGGGGTGATITSVGGTSLAGTSGVINTGGGAGGGSSIVTGAPSGSIGVSGGSGVVILRYPTADLPYFTTTGTLNTPSATDTVADAAYPVTNLAYYKLDSNANDSSGNGYNGTASNITYGNGRFNEAANFNGSNSTIATPITTNYSNLSISCWVKFNALPTGGADATLVSKGFYTSPSNTQYLHLRYEDYTNRFKFAVRNNSAYNSQADSGVSATTGVWYHVVGTLSSSGNAQIYVNGVAGTEITGAPSMTNSNDFEIGSFISNVALLNGSIDQVRIFSSALAPGDVEDLYNEHFQTKFTDGSDTALKFTGGTGDITFADTAPVFTPGDNFNTVLYTGNNGTQSITGVGFQPDFTWIKARDNGSNNHALTDSVRGTGSGNGLSSNTTGAEGQYSAAYGYLSAFSTDGFTVQAGSTSPNFVNSSSANYVAWSWKAGGAARNNTDGSIASLVSANVDAGFSIVKWTGDATSNPTVGHGLNQEPEIYFLKGLDNGTDSWIVSGNSTIFSSPTTNFLRLNTTASVGSTTANAVGSNGNVINIGVRTYNGQETIAYCFHSVAGYSKIGSYVGNAGSNTIVTGFEPGFVMMKCSSNSAIGYWDILDNKRNTTNPRNKELFPNDSIAEYNGNRNVNFTLTGFELTSSSYNNNSGETYIYMAFATNPT